MLEFLEMRRQANIRFRKQKKVGRLMIMAFANRSTRYVFYVSTVMHRRKTHGRYVTIGYRLWRVVLLDSKRIYHHHILLPAITSIRTNVVLLYFQNDDCGN